MMEEGSAEYTDSNSTKNIAPVYEGVSKIFWTGRLERELQMVQLSILWASLLRFVAISLCVTSQLVFVVIVYFVIDSVRKLLDTFSCYHKGKGKFVPLLA